MVRNTHNALHDTWKVQWIAPVHCTGEPAFAILKQTFGDHYLYAGLGTTVLVAKTVTTVAEAGQPPMQAMDEADLMTYRAMLAQSDDIRHEADSEVRFAARP